MIRLPARVRGKNHIRYGDGFTTGYSCRIEAFGDGRERIRLSIGKNCVIGDYAHIVANDNVEIGDNVLMASRVFISDTSHGCYDSSEEQAKPEEHPNARKLSYGSVKIGHNVWIGENVSILQGVEIGDGCVIGANSVVTKSVGPNMILAGCPARIIKSYNYESKQWEKYKHDAAQ